jgi:ABC-2 type transport system ATP-binding protein
VTGAAGGPGSWTYGLTIETQGLSKRFGQQLAVDSLDLAVPQGAVFGFLGPNGSGKTTTIRMLLGLAAASGGTVRLLGMEMPGRFQEVLPHVGALVEGPAFYPFLSGTANLHRLDAATRHASPATRSSRVNLALERVGLGHAAGKRVHAYSLGMKQRLGIANALLSPRELLVLDEPTNGLDPQGTREVRNLVRSLAADGTTVFVSSHLLAEVEQICTHAAVMSAGRLVAQGPLQELRRSGSTRIRLLTPDAWQQWQYWPGWGWCRRKQQHSRTARWSRRRWRQPQETLLLESGSPETLPLEAQPLEAQPIETSPLRTSWRPSCRPVSGSGDSPWNGKALRTGSLP